MSVFGGELTVSGEIERSEDVVLQVAWEPYTRTLKDRLFFWRLRLRNGRLPSSDGHIWRRRRRDGSYEYEQSPETFDEWSERQW